jgi:hypothetical protein
MARTPGTLIVPGQGLVRVAPGNALEIVVVIGLLW